MINIHIADFSNPAHAGAILFLLNEYAKDPMGGGEELSDFAKANLVNEMAKRPSVHAILAFVNGKPAGLTNCIEGFSTFACKPLLNIHDMVVLAEFRGQGISSQLLKKAEELATSLDCLASIARKCDVVLEGTDEFPSLIVFGNNALAASVSIEAGCLAWR